MRFITIQRGGDIERIRIDSEGREFQERASVAALPQPSRESETLRGDALGEVLGSVNGNLLNPARNADLRDQNRADNARRAERATARNFRTVSPGRGAGDSTRIVADAINQSRGGDVSLRDLDRRNAGNPNYRSASARRRLGQLANSGQVQRVSPGVFRAIPR